MEGNWISLYLSFQHSDNDTPILKNGRLRSKNGNVQGAIGTLKSRRPSFYLDSRRKYMRNLDEVQPIFVSILRPRRSCNIIVRMDISSLNKRLDVQSRDQLRDTQPTSVSSRSPGSSHRNLRRQHTPETQLYFALFLNSTIEGVSNNSAVEIDPTWPTSWRVSRGL